MRKENQVNEATTDATEEDVSVSEATAAYLKQRGVTKEQVMQSLKEMAAAMRIMPKEMDSMLLSYFINNLLDVYGLDGADRIELLMSVMQMTEGAKVGVMRFEKDEDGNVTPVDDEEDDLCGCPKCTAERAAGRQLH